MTTLARGHRWGARAASLTGNLDWAPLRLCLWALAAAVSGAPRGAEATPPARPNIIFIMADDLGIGDIGVNGQNARAAAGLPAIPTPNIDALANESVSFTRMYSNPLCAPTRAMLLTGFDMPHSHRDAVESTNGLRGGELDKTWGQALQAAGYKTGMFGKWHLGGVDWAPYGPLGVYDRDSIPTQKGFDIVFGTLAGGYHNEQLWENDDQGGLKLTSNVYTPEWTGPGPPFKFTEDTQTDRMVKMVKDYAGGSQPFAIYAAMQAPHVPFNEIGTGEFTNRDWPLAQKQYAAMVSDLDMNVGRLMAAVNDPNDDGDPSDSVASQTLVVFTSDNGPVWDMGNGFRTEYFNSNGPYRGQKSSTYEGGIRTPFFVRWKGVTTPGRVDNDRVGSLADIYPTLAELTGQDAPLGQDGVSMLSAITGQGPIKQQDDLVWSDRVAYTNPPSWAIQMAGWKLIQRMWDHGFELYNISADPSETTNLASSRPDVRAALQAVAGLEGMFEEPYYATGDYFAPYNVSYTQYKNWAPHEGSTDFGAAANWGGGSQFNRPDDPESLFWNSAPAAIWLATMANTLGGNLDAVASADAKVLALEIRGEAGPMQVSVTTGARLDAFNGVRIASGGTLRLVGGTLATAGDVEVRAGGSLTGAGLITGYQTIIAAVPEFQGKHLLEPDVHNLGTVDVGPSDSAGLLSINGNFEQGAFGQLNIDVFGNGGVEGVDFDKLTITGAATLAGSLYLDLDGIVAPEVGTLFPVLSAGNLSLAGLRLIGPEANLFTYSVVAGTDLVLSYAGPLDPLESDFDGNGVVDAADLTIWQEDFRVGGDPGHVIAGPVRDGALFLLWQRQFGMRGRPTTPPLIEAATVPEPTSLASGLVAIVAALLLELGESGEAKHS